MEALSLTALGLALLLQVGDPEPVYWLPIAIEQITTNLVA